MFPGTVLAVPTKVPSHTDTIPLKLGLKLFPMGNLVVTIWGRREYRHLDVKNECHLYSQPDITINSGLCIIVNSGT